MENYFGRLGKDPVVALAKVAPIVDGILKAQDDADYEAFCSFFEGPLQQNVTKSDFEQNAAQIHKTMGKLKEKQFVTSMKRQGLIGLVYKCHFDGSEDDFLITITINDQSEELKASGIWIS